MDTARKIVFAPHDDGQGGFAVLWRVARALVRVADARGCTLNLYFLNSSAADRGQDRMDRLLEASANHSHTARYVLTDNLIRLPKDPETASVRGDLIPPMLAQSVGRFWNQWPIEPPAGGSDPAARVARSLCKADGCELTDQWWRDVDLGISMGVAQLHRVARTTPFPSIEVGDWFFSLGLERCMNESKVSEEIMIGTKPYLDMIAADEFKAKEAWLTLYQAPLEPYRKYLAGRVDLHVMEGLLWTGDPPPIDIATWPEADELRRSLAEEIGRVRGTTPGRIAYIVGGATGVWKEIVGRLESQNPSQDDAVAVIDMNRSDNSIWLLETGGVLLAGATERVRAISDEDAHLRICRASDFIVTRTAGGVLSAAETQRPSVLVDEPGHWLGRLQRDQCREAGLCVVIPLADFLKAPRAAIQTQADQIGAGGELDRIVDAARKLKIGIEAEFARYLFDKYLQIPE